MTPLDYYMKKDMDPRLPGFFSNTIKRGYNLFDELVKREPSLQLFQARNAYGMLRHIYVDILLQDEAEKSDIDLKIKNKKISQNGYTYPIIYSGDAVITTHKTRSKKSLPQSAWNRTNRSYLNDEISLFDDENIKSSASVNPYLMVTYGGSNYKLDYVNLGLPNIGVTSWNGIKDITDSVSTLSTNSTYDKREINLAFNDKVKEIMKIERENKDVGGKV